MTDSDDRLHDRIEGGRKGEDVAIAILERFKRDGARIEDHWGTGNVDYLGNSFEIDRVVCISDVGFLLLEVKNWRGTTRMSASDDWTLDSGARKMCPCKQLERAERHFRRLSRAGQQDQRRVRYRDEPSVLPVWQS